MRVIFLIWAKHGKGNGTKCIRRYTSLWEHRKDRVFLHLSFLLAFEHEKNFVCRGGIITNKCPPRPLAFIISEISKVVCCMMAVVFIVILNV